MNKTKFLTGLVLLLLLVNICLSVLIYMNKQQPHRAQGPRNEIIEKLHLDDAQIKIYDTLIAKHRSDIKNAQGEMKSMKNKLYAGLKSSALISNADSLITEINKVQNKIEYIHLHHFQDIQKLCKPGQLKYFDALTEEIARLFSPHPHDRK